jgi:hypothetical protein
MNGYTNDVCKRLRLTAMEFGHEVLKNAVVIDAPYNYGETSIGGIPFINCPTISGQKLGNVDYKVARFFADCGA